MPGEALVAVYHLSPGVGTRPAHLFPGESLAPPWGERLGAWPALDQLETLPQATGGDLGEASPAGPLELGPQPAALRQGGLKWVPTWCR